MALRRTAPRSTAWPPADFAVADDAAVLDAVGPREDEGQRQVLDGLGGVVAGKRARHARSRRRGRCRVRSRHRRRARPARGARRRRGRKDRSRRGVMSRKTKSLSPLAGHQHGRHHAAFAARQARREGGAAVGVGLGRAEDLVVAGKQRQVDAGQRLGGAERAGEDVEPVLAGIGGRGRCRRRRTTAWRATPSRRCGRSRAARSAHRRRACGSAAPRRSGSWSSLPC